MVRLVSIGSLYNISVPLKLWSQFTLLNLGSYIKNLSIADVLLLLWKNTYIGRETSNILCPIHKSTIASSGMCAACPTAPISIGKSMKGSSSDVYSSIKMT